jgi:hypothetical protein
MKRGVWFLFVTVLVTLLLVPTQSSLDTTAEVRAQQPTATPTLCPDGLHCNGQKRYADRWEAMTGDDGVYGVYGTAYYSDPCVVWPDPILGTTPNVRMWLLARSTR